MSIDDQPTCVVFITGMLSSPSGGDIHAARFAEHWACTRGPAYILAPPHIAKVLKPGSGVRVLSPSFPFETLIQGRMATYPLLCLIRAFVYAGASPRATCSISATHFFGDVAAAIISSKNGTRAVFVHHIVALSGRRLSWRSRVSVIQERLCLRIIRGFDTVLVVDRGAHTWLTRHMDATKLIATTNGYDPPFGDGIRRKRHHVLFLGRLTPEKGGLDFIRIASIMTKSNPRLHFNVVGNGPLRESMARAARAEGITCTFHGYVDEETKNRLLAENRLLIAPSYEEGWGMAVDEALGAGADVVCYKLPAYEDLGSAVHAVPRGDHKAAAKAALALIEDTGARRVASAPDRSLPWRLVLETETQALMSHECETPVRCTR